ncbi:glutamate--tRNA ligase [Parvibaculum sedimenti]|uniref:Glutamate--tRNA ligase n=1 Tax=Parvibaculum sedimenti TaxID=2608632 RepID=A0A6N6VCY2_9HYPH|nr:glutamate--tRNA ligase [Parvibaculum sedimenti]KAB7738536.1 glutamate--tRNA ligase [Parvibaculum sedimenti]
MTVIARFAPSPTGKLHVGNIRAALFSWLYAKKAGGKYLLRLDDTDTERSTEEFAKGIEADLEWLGLKHDIFARQSDRIAEYESAVAALKEAGRLYPCYETGAELERKRKLQLSQKKPPVYDRAALRLTEDEKRALEAEGRRPHWRFKLDSEKTGFDDLVQGHVAVDAASLSDPVLVREDGSFLYTLPSVVDDIEFRITHVVRGADHITNTGVQIQITRALGTEPPVYAHFSLLQGPEGRPLSKREDAAFSIEALREAGYEPMALNSLLARLGTSDAIEPRLTLEELADGFDISHLGRADIRFDPADLDKTNAALLHLTPYEGVIDRLDAANCNLGKAFWDAVRPNLVRFADVKDWARVVQGPIAAVIEDAGFTAEAASLLPEEPWGTETWGLWTEAVKGKTGRKGKALFMPLRLALTGLAHGPELKNLLPLIGRERAEARLRGVSL